MKTRRLKQIKIWYDFNLLRWVTFHQKSGSKFNKNNKQASVAVSKKAMPNYAYIYNELKQKKKTKVTLQLLWEEYKELNPDGIVPGSVPMALS